MKKLITSVRKALGLPSPAAPTAGEVQTVPASKLRFSLPIIALEELQFVEPTRETFEGAPQFQQDEWALISFFPEARLSEIQGHLREYKAFEADHRDEYGWKKIYTLQLDRTTVLPGATALAELAAKVDGDIRHGPLLSTSSRPIGQVKDGFSVCLAEDVDLYGIANEQGLTILAALVGSGADYAVLSRAFTVLNRSDRLILVDWLNQMILVSADPAGKIEVWRP